MEGINLIESFEPNILSRGILFIASKRNYYNSTNFNRSCKISIDQVHDFTRLRCSIEFNTVPRSCPKRHTSHSLKYSILNNRKTFYTTRTIHVDYPRVCIAKRDVRLTIAIDGACESDAPWKVGILATDVRKFNRVVNLVDSGES